MPAPTSEVGPCKRPPAFLLHKSIGGQPVTARSKFQTPAEANILANSAGLPHTRGEKSGHFFL